MRPYVITLSSIPSRFDRLGLTLETLRRQSVRPEAIIVYIPKTYRRFPEWDGCLPEVPEGIEIRRTDVDYGPATKVLPALKDYAGTDMEILFCDDDMDYPADWAIQFLRQREKRPEDSITLCGEYIDMPPISQRPDAPRPRAWRLWREPDMEQNLRMLVEYFGRAFLGWPERFVGRRRCWVAGYIDTFQGYGGVMVRADFFDDEVFDIPPVLWSVDDFWLSGHAIRNGHPPWMIPRRREATSHAHFALDDLASSEIDGARRDEANAQAVAYMQNRYGIWL